MKTERIHMTIIVAMLLGGCGDPTADGADGDAGTRADTAAATADTSPPPIGDPDAGATGPSADAGATGMGGSADADVVADASAAADAATGAPGMTCTPFFGTECADGEVCMDDPTDDCEWTSGVDCPGVCVAAGSGVPGGGGGGGGGGSGGPGGFGMGECFVELGFSCADGEECVDDPADACDGFGCPGTCAPR